MTKAKEDLIDEIMTWFDFPKVHKAMKLLEWKWGALDPDNWGVPSLGRIRERARELLGDAYDYGQKHGEGYTVASGGFWAEYTPEYNHLSLKFQVADWEASDAE